jgi:proline dehydrogenase
MLSLNALRVASQLQSRGMNVSIDYLGESVRDQQMAESVVEEYLRVLPAMAQQRLDVQVSLKLTQLGLDIDEAFCRQNLERIVQQAGDVGGFVRIDMENSVYTQRTLDLFYSLHDRFPNLGVVIQAYLYRSEADIQQLVGARLRCDCARGRTPSRRASPIPNAARWTRRTVA